VKRRYPPIPSKVSSTANWGDIPSTSSEPVRYVVEDAPVAYRVRLEKPKPKRKRRK
jgi:hypothetical protein